MKQMCRENLAGTAAFILICLFHDVIASDRYACYPNGTITINNPNSTVFDGVIATYNDGTNINLCSVSGTDTVMITNCNLTFPITVVFSDRDDVSDNIKGGTRVQTFTLKCNEITDHTIANLNGSLGITLPVTPEGPVTPTYSISAGFYDAQTIASGSPTYIASVGDVIYFIMTGPVEYYLLPLECIAYNNPSKAAATSNKTVIINGCGTDSKLMSGFTRNPLTFDFEYWATFYVFKFYQSDDVFLECSVRVCPKPSNCAFSCGVGKRSVEDTYAGLEGEDSRIATIGRRLRIQSPPLGAASEISAPASLTCVICLAIILGIYT